MIHFEREHPASPTRRNSQKCRSIFIVYRIFSVYMPLNIHFIYILSVELTFENMYQRISKQNALQGLPANTGAAMVQILKSPLCSWFYIVHVVMRRFSKFMKLAWSLRDLRATTAPLQYRFSKVSSAVALWSKLIC